MSTGPDTPHDVPMSLGDHLEELRRRMILAIGGVLAAGVVTLYFGRDLVTWLCRPLMYALRDAGLPPQVYALSPLAGFSVYIQVSLIAAVIIGLPWVMYQAWRFIEVGLRRRERKLVLSLVPLSAAMAGLSVAFTYYVMLPSSLWFLISFSSTYPSVGMAQPPGWWSILAGKDTPEGSGSSGVQGVDRVSGPPVRVPILEADPAQPADGQMWLVAPLGELRFRYGGVTRSITLNSPSIVNPLIEIDQYIGFVAATALGCVVAFQLPVVMMIVGWTGLVDPAWLAQYRRLCVLGCFFLGMVLSPADVLSMIVLSLPLWGLFELGMWLMKRAYGRHRLAG